MTCSPKKRLSRNKSRLNVSVPDREQDAHLVRMSCI